MGSGLAFGIVLVAREQLWVFIVAPVLGALVAAAIYQALFRGGRQIAPEQSAARPSSPRSPTTGADPVTIEVAPTNQWMGGV